MGQIRSFTSALDITLESALTVARESFPDIDFAGVQTKEDLETLMTVNDVVLYVEVDGEKELAAILEKEDNLSAEISAGIGEDTSACAPDLPTLSFSDEDLAGQDFCQIPESEFPPAPKVDDEEIADLENTIAGILKDNDDAVSKMQDCIQEMQSITDQLNILLKKEGDLRNLLINLEEILYNYRIMDGYFGKRLRVLNKFLKLFDPMILDKRKLEQEEIPEINAKILPKRAAYDIIVGRLTINPGANLTPAEQALYDEVNGLISRRDQKKLDLGAVNDQIALEKGKIVIFGDDLLHTGTELQRRAILEADLAALFGGNVSSVFAKVAEFSNRTSIRPKLNNANYGQSFEVELRFNFGDPQGLINHQPKKFLASDFLVKVTPIPGNGSGVLYEKLYNIWGDIELFFTPEERGLTSNSNFIAPEVKDTGAETTASGLLISNLGAYEEFYTRFGDHHKSKTDFVKTNFIEPKLAEVVRALEDFATKEVEYLLSFGLVFQDLPAESPKLGTIIQNLTSSSDLYERKMRDIRAAYLDASAQHDRVLIDIETKKNEYSNVSCAAGSDDPNIAPPEPGADPLGKTSLLRTDPKLPDPTKFCYWKRFALMATAVNLLPLIPRYWPIGFLIPSPNGLIKIPLPIVWFPIAVIPLPVGLFVILIGQCGICPSPFVLYIGPNGEKKFIISLRPTKKFGSDASEPLIKALEKGGVAVNMTINEMMDLPQFPPIALPDSKGSILDDMEDKIIKKIRKLRQPNVEPMRSLPPDATVTEKRDAIGKVMTDYLKNLDLPDFKLPKNGAKVNPKPTPVSEMIDTIKKASRLELPQMSIPPMEKINLKDMLVTEVQKIDMNEVDVPPIEAPTGTGPQAETQRKKYLDSINHALSAVSAAAAKQLTPQRLGILATASTEVSFFNAYKCRPTAKGITLPGIPVPVVLAIGAMMGLTTNIINGLTVEDVFRLNGGPIVGKQNLRNLLANALNALPNIEVPNPSKMSIKDMLKDSLLKMSAIQLPSLPDPTMGVQIRLNIPGAAVKSVIVAAVDNTVKALPTADVDALVNFQTVTPVDMKQIATSIVENSFDPLENFLNPFLDIVTGYGKVKDKTFAETLDPTLKLWPEKDDTKIQIITKEVMDTALKILDTIAMVPYPAVAVAPDTFGHLHPILESDDLPPWERLSMKNFLFIIFLDQLAHRAKQGGGFFENPV